MTRLILSPELRCFFPGADAFDRILALQGQTVRDKEGRRTLRVELGEKSYFAKLHFGVGWREIIKNLVKLKKPVISAKDEWLALQRLERIGVPTLKIAGYGIRNRNPACQHSFLITEELSNSISLEELTYSWAKAAPPFQLKNALIQNVAEIARKLHENGINHRDFYIGHFLVDRSSLAEPDPGMVSRLQAVPGAQRNPQALPEPAKAGTTYSELSQVHDSNAPPVFNLEALQELGPRRHPIHVIDLHRAQIRSSTPRRWIIKDLASLLFSSFDVPLTRRDLFRFIAVYRSRPWRDALRDERSFWNAVWLQAVRLYKKVRRRNPPQKWLNGTSREALAAQIAKPSTSVSMVPPADCRSHPVSNSMAISK